MPARSAGLPSSTARTSSALALGQADGAAQPARHVRRRDRDAEPRPRAASRPARGARRARRRRRPRARRGSGRRRGASRSARAACPRASTSGPPPEPRGSGAVCSIAPVMRRPRGPRKLRRARTRRSRAWRAGRGRRGWRARSRRVPIAAAPRGRIPARRRRSSPVSTSTTARSRSASTPATRPRLAAAVGEDDRHLVARAGCGRS